MINFLNYQYLKDGSDRQKSAYEAMNASGIMELLTPFDPILTGTVPIGIDTVDSDLDITCCYTNAVRFKDFLEDHLSHFSAFELKQGMRESGACVVARFTIRDWKVEIFGQNIPSERQYSFLHMVIEQKVLEERGSEFRKQVIALKRKGMKTEPAFALLLGISGDPYDGLLEYGRSMVWDQDQSLGIR